LLEGKRVPRFFRHSLFLGPWQLCFRHVPFSRIRYAQSEFSTFFALCESASFLSRVHQGAYSDFSYYKECWSCKRVVQQATRKMRYFQKFGACQQVAILMTQDWERQKKFKGMHRKS